MLIDVLPRIDADWRGSRKRNVLLTQEHTVQIMNMTDDRNLTSPTVINVDRNE
jgi:hypothetical protein